VPRLLKEGISEGQAKQLVDSYVPMVNRALGKQVCHGSTCAGGAAAACIKMHMNSAPSIPFGVCHLLC
jgi:hypothetical protein